jgi:uncharacterized protein YndB with AHSA1/START domain
MEITIYAGVKAPIDAIWDCFTLPEHIVEWNFASDDWYAPEAENDLRAGGEFVYTMAAKDGSMSFEFTGIYTEVYIYKQINYLLSDGRRVQVNFQTAGDEILITQTFEAENENPVEMQEAGWQAILNNFKDYVERLV